MVTAGGTVPYYVLEHSHCGHPGGLGQTREMLEARKRVAVGAGYYNWRVRKLRDDEVDRVIEAILVGPCDVCRMDTSRGALPAAVAAARAELTAGNLPGTHLVFVDDCGSS